MSDPLYDIAMVAVELRIAAPREFDKLVVALKTLEDRANDELRAAGPNVIFTAQGKAQLLTQLRQKFENCMAIKQTHDQRK